MPNTNNSNTKLGMYEEPIEVGDWRFHKNNLCRVLKINRTFTACKVNVDARNIFLIAKDIRDMPQYLKPKVDVIDKFFLEATNPKY